MATVTEMRAWLRDNGHDVPQRGVLRPDLVDAYNDAHADPMNPEWPDDADLLDVGVDDEPAPVRAETRPSRPARQRKTASQRADSVIGRVLFGEGKKPQPKARGKQPPRMSLEKFTGRLYSMAGRVLTPISPAAANCVTVQGPMAGVLLEEALRGTVADRVLQPLARAEEKLDVAFALVAPPLACMAIEMASQLEPSPQVMLRKTVAFQMLREGLRTGLEISEKYGDKIAEVIERQRRSDEEVDRLISLIFPPPPEAEYVPGAEMAGAAA
jgi:hypothetical protein